MLTDEAVETRVLTHYRLVGAAMERHFAGTPMVFTNFFGGFSTRPYWHRTDLPFSQTKMLWLCHRMFALEFYSWVPIPTDIDRLRFARILLELPPSIDALKAAALELRALLAQHNLEAAPIYDGEGGMALWIPLADAPRSEAVRTWLHSFCNQAVQARPDLFTIESNTHGTERVHLHVASNAPGRCSALPCSVRGRGGFEVSRYL